MYQILFRLPGFLPGIGGAPIYGYGVMMVVGFFLAMGLAKFLAKHSKLDPEIFANAALIALVAGVVGARLSHVLENLADYTKHDLSFGQNLWNAVNIRSGGLTYYGGFLLAFPALVAYAWFKRVPLPLGMDIIAPCLMVGLGLGRVGCYLNGCCYGAQTNVAWAVQFPYRSDAYFEQLNKGEITVPPELLSDKGVPRSIEDIENDRTIDSAQRASLVKLAQSQKALPVHPARLYSTITALLIMGVFAGVFHIAARAGAGVCADADGGGRFAIFAGNGQSGAGGDAIWASCFRATDVWRGVEHCERADGGGVVGDFWVEADLGGESPRARTMTKSPITNASPCDTGS